MYCSPSERIGLTELPHTRQLFQVFIYYFYLLGDQSIVRISNPAVGDDVMRSEFIASECKSASTIILTSFSKSTRGTQPRIRFAFAASPISEVVSGDRMFSRS